MGGDFKENSTHRYGSFQRNNTCILLITPTVITSFLLCIFFLLCNWHCERKDICLCLWLLSSPCTLASNLKLWLQQLFRTEGWASHEERECPQIRRIGSPLTFTFSYLLLQGQAGTTVGLFFSFLLALCNVMILRVASILEVTGKIIFKSTAIFHCINFLTIKNQLNSHIFVQCFSQQAYIFQSSFAENACVYITIQSDHKITIFNYTFALIFLRKTTII